MPKRRASTSITATTTAEALVAEGRQFDAVLALEVVEHVAEPAAFLASIGRLVRPGGAVVLSTLNRTAKAYALGDRRCRICAALGPARDP